MVSLYLPELFSSLLLLNLLMIKDLNALPSCNAHAFAIAKEETFYRIHS